MRIKILLLASIVEFSVLGSIFSQTTEINADDLKLVKEHYIELVNDYDKFDINTLEGKQAFIDAICLNLENTVKQFIDKGIDVNFRIEGPKNMGTYSPLAYACFYSNCNIINELIKAGADINFKTTFFPTNYSKDTINLVAGLIKTKYMFNIDPWYVKMYNEPGSNIQREVLWAKVNMHEAQAKESILNATNIKGYKTKTDLSNQNFEFIDEAYHDYLKYKEVSEKYVGNFKLNDKTSFFIRLNSPINDFFTWLAYFSNDVDYKKTVACLIENGFDIETVDEHETPFLVASLYCVRDIVELLLEKGANIYATDYFDEDALFNALDDVFITDPKVVELLVEAGMDVNKVQGQYSKKSPFEEALDNEQNLEVIKILVENGGTINDGSWIKNYLMRRNNQLNLDERLKVIEYLIDNNMPTDSVLIAASYTPYYVTVHKLLLEKGVDINQTNKRGQTPLWVAMNNNRGGLVKFYIENGADVNKVGDELYMALKMYQIEDDERREIVDMLIKAGVNLKGEAGRKALAYAFEENYYDCANLLVRGGVEWQDMLVDYCSSGYREGVYNILILEGLNLNKTYKNGKTVYEAAMEANKEGAKRDNKEDKPNKKGKRKDIKDLLLQHKNHNKIEINGIYY